MFKLKNYQRAALDTIEAFLSKCNEGNPVEIVFKEFSELSRYDKLRGYFQREPLLLHPRTDRRWKNGDCFRCDRKD